MRSEESILNTTSKDSYTRSSQQRARRRKSPWNLALFFTAVVYACAVAYLMVSGLLYLQHSRFPHQAILTSHTRIGGIFLVFTLFPSLAAGMILGNLVMWCIPAARRTFEKEAKGIKGTSFKSSMKQLFLAFMATLVIFGPLCVLGAMSYFYVTPDGVHYSQLFSLAERHYDWGDVVEIKTRVAAERKNLHLNYILLMKDGNKIDLMEEPRLKFVAAYPRLKPIIRSQPHIRYSSEITQRGVNRLKRQYSRKNAIAILETLTDVPEQ